MLLSSPLTKFLGSGHPRLVAKCAGFAMGLALVVSACAQQPATPPSPAQVHVQSRTSPVHHKEGRPQAPDRGPRPAAPTDAAPKPPQVTLDAGSLTIDANNSDLSTIIEKVAHESGMTVDGLDKSGRVFGVYGPGAPRDVLTELLSGSGYNFMLLGGANGSVPTQLVLTAQSSTPPSANGRRAASPQDDADDSDAAYQEPLGPGAIAHPRPQESDDIDPQARAQQRLQNLQQMHDELEQRAQQQQNNPQ
jgi:hypothetical protein